MRVLFYLSSGIDFSNLFNKRCSQFARSYQTLLNIGQFVATRSPMLAKVRQCLFYNFLIDLHMGSYGLYFLNDLSFFLFRLFFYAYFLTVPISRPGPAGGCAAKRRSSGTSRSSPSRTLRGGPSPRRSRRSSPTSRQSCSP